MAADLASGSKGSAIKTAIEQHVESVKEIAEVLVWRNKVFGHFAITDPRKDNTATLDMSVVFPVALDERYCVGTFAMHRSGPSGSFQSELPHWSLTKVFESLEPRYWPGLTYVPCDPPPGEEHSHPAIDRLRNNPVMRNMVGGTGNGADGAI